MSRLPLLLLPVALLSFAAPATARASLLPEGKYDCAAFSGNSFYVDCTHRP